MTSVRTRGAALACALSAWLGTASAASSDAPEARVDAPAAPAAAPVSDAPLELEGVAFQGETHGERVVADSGQVATPAPSASIVAPKRFDALVVLSAADGVGLGGQVRSGRFGLRGAVTYQPLFFLVDADPADKKFGRYEFASSIQLNVDALLVGVESERGGSLGYRFNDLLGHGFTLAYQSAFDMWGQHFNLSFPVTYYPAASSRVRERLGIAKSDEINFPFGAGLQFGVGAGWVL